MSEDRYDLTTAPGMKLALKYFDHPMHILANPVLYILVKAIKAYQNNSVPTLKQQEDAAVNIIKAGKEQGVKRLKIKVNNKVGAGMAAKVNELGVDIHGHIGTDDCMEMEIEYK